MKKRKRKMGEGRRRPGLECQRRFPPNQLFGIEMKRFDKSVVVFEGGGSLESCFSSRDKISLLLFSPLHQNSVTAVSEF